MNLGRVSILLVVLVPIFAHAQIAVLFNRPINLTVVPEHPAPGETVRLSLTSGAMDLDRSQITWEANGTSFAEGIGLKEARITAGETGSVTNISVRAEAENGDTGLAEARISPSEMELLWSTDSYAPPFFKGRKLAGADTRMSAYALTHFTRNGVRVPEADIIYSWYRNGVFIAEVSGRGKSRAVLRGPTRGTDLIRVDAEAADRTESAEASARVSAYDSKLILYENHPLFGILFHRAIVGDVNTIERELNLTAVPYFARTHDPSTLSYEWTVNDMAIESHPEEPETLTVTAKEYTGPADIGLSAMNSMDVLMRSVGSWRIIFGGSSGIFTSGLFGE